MRELGEEELAFYILAIWALLVAIVLLIIL